MHRVILRSFQSPGDVLMLTVAVRDLHAAFAGQFQTDIRTSADALWENNPYITPLRESDPGVEVMDMHYPLIHESNQRPYHFIHGYVQFLEQQLNLRISLTRFHGDIHLSAKEKETPPHADSLPERFWIIVAGGKYDFTAKWWNPDGFQKVVDHFQDTIQFVQCGGGDHWHPRLRDAVDFVGRTNLREFVQLMHHAEGVVCPVTFAMHLAAAVESKPGTRPLRPCVVIAGAREPAHWEAYPHHQYISTVGTLSCCAEGGCWRSRCQLVGDGDEKDRKNVCEKPVQVTSDLRIPQCMEMIRAEDVIRRIEMYRSGDLQGRRNVKKNGRPTLATATATKEEAKTASTQPVLIQFRHGLGDAVQLTIVLRHLQHYHPDWQIDVGALVGKHSAFHGLCNSVFRIDKDKSPRSDYRQVFDLEWAECATCFADCPSTKAERCLVEIFRLAPIADLCRYTIQPRKEAFGLARRYLENTCQVNAGADGRYPVVLIHYEGNTSANEKNLPVDLVRELCNDIISCGAVPIILDWDSRTPLADEKRIFNPHVHVELWGGMGTGDAEVLAALTELATLMVGVDSGPLHVAGATETPTIGVWTRHHPLHYFSLAENVTHLLPDNHVHMLRGDRTVGERYFRENYHHRTYTNLASTLRSLVKERLGASKGGLVYTRNFWIRSDNSDQDLVVVNDIAEQDTYRIDELPMPRPVVVDIGAHIGCFSWKLHQRNPMARIIAVECCPENIPALQKNVDGFATVVHGAVTYEKDIALLNAVFPNCESTGGTTVVSREELRKKMTAHELESAPNGKPGQRYWADLRPVPTLTLEQLCREHEFEYIDILKLDCEGSEFSILGETTMLDRIGVIVGEYHGKERFHRLAEERFSSWDLRILKDGELGTFWLSNPSRRSASAIRGTVSIPKPPEKTHPSVLLAALRNENEPDGRYDLLLMEERSIRLRYQHPRGYLRGFVKAFDRLWTIDSKGVLYHVEFDGSAIHLNKVSASNLAWEAHDLTIIDGCIATAGPLQNAIVLYDTVTKQWTTRRPWLPLISIPTENPGPDRCDRHHLNSVIQDGESVILSFFTAMPKPDGTRWRDSKLDEGMIIRWGRNGFDDKPLATGVYAPHSVRVWDGHVWWCDSFRGAVCCDDGWRSPDLGGFTRGLRFTEDGKCIVGLSRSRVDPNPTLEKCGFSIFHPDRPEERDYVELDLPYIEVYDVWAIEERT